MTRPCILVLDREHSGTISTRKLVIESAKFNVITAYSGAEALETFTRFPNVDGVILNANVRDISCAQIIATIRSSAPQVPFIVVQGPGAHPCLGATHSLDSFDPVPLLELLHNLFRPSASAIKQQDDALNAEESQA